MAKLSEFLAGLKLGHKNVRITVGDNETFIGWKIDGETACKLLGEDRLKYLDTHTPIHEYYSFNEIHYVFRASDKYTALCG